MKKYKRYSVLILLVLAACSDDDNSASQEIPEDQEMEEVSEMLTIPTSINVLDISADQNTQINIGYDQQNRIALITSNGIESGTITETTITYNEAGLITNFLEEEVEPSPFSTEFQFEYNETGILTLLTSIIDGGTANMLPVSYDAAANSYTISDGGEQVYVFDPQNNLISCTAVGIPVLGLVHNASGTGLMAELGTQVALGILLGGLNPSTAFGLYYFSTLEISTFSFFDNEIQLNTIRDTEGLIIEIEALNGGEITSRTTITYETIEL